MPSPGPVPTTRKVRPGSTGRGAIGPTGFSRPGAIPASDQAIDSKSLSTKGSWATKDLIPLTDRYQRQLGRVIVSPRVTPATARPIGRPAVESWFSRV